MSTTVAAAGTGTAARSGVEVRMEELRRRYAGVTALDGLSLTMAPGELVALLGPSGCGKTTALRLVAGLEEADEGRVLIAGDDVTDRPANKRDVGMVFQAYSLFPHMTAWQNVAFGLQMRDVNIKDRRKRAGEMLELVGLSGFANRFAHQLSGGQQQRVALARALAIRPKVLLLDEPLSALDAKVRARLRDEIRRVQLEVGITTLFVTHDQEEALAIASSWSSWVRPHPFTRGRRRRLLPNSLDSPTGFLGSSGAAASMFEGRGFRWWSQTSLTVPRLP